MTLFFFKKSEIHLDAFTTRKDVVEYAPVVEGIKVIPDWWRKLPKSQTESSFFPKPTMKTCAGMRDYYINSVAMPLWSDFCVESTGGGAFNWQFSDGTSSGGGHPIEQYRGFSIGEQYSHFKLSSPWFFKTKEDLNWLLTDPIYNREELRNYFVPQGILNFKYQAGTNIQLFLDTATPRTYIIPFGTVFLFTPMTDKKVVIHRHLLSEEEAGRVIDSGTPSTFINKYKVHKSIEVCPYKNGVK